MAFLQCMRSYGCADSSSILAKFKNIYGVQFSQKLNYIQLYLCRLYPNHFAPNTHDLATSKVATAACVFVCVLYHRYLLIFLRHIDGGVGREAANKKKYVSLHSNWTMAGFGVVARSTQAQSVRQAAGIRESVRTPVPLIMALQWLDALFRLLFLTLSYCRCK